MEDEDISKGLEIVRNGLERAFKDLIKEDIEKRIKQLEMTSQMSKELAKDFIRLSKIYDESVIIAKSPLEYIDLENDLDDVREKIEGLTGQLNKKAAEAEVCILMLTNKMEAFLKYIDN